MVNAGDVYVYSQVEVVLLKDISVRMQLASLADFPSAPLPSGFSYRYYQPGDDALWVALYDAAESIVDISLQVFREQFYGNEAALQQRMFFILNDAGHPIATSTAWYDDVDNDETLGRVHWVAVHPDYQGRGLAKPLLSKTLETLQACGQSSAYLMTSTSRIPALTLYMRYGFVPYIRHDEDLQAWQQCLPLMRPEAKTVLEQALKSYVNLGQ